jgi:hypothetical protein
MMISLIHQLLHQRQPLANANAILLAGYRYRVIYLILRVDEIQFGLTTLGNQYRSVSYALKLIKSLQAHGISHSTSRRIISTMEKINL